MINFLWFMGGIIVAIMGVLVLAAVMASSRFGYEEEKEREKRKKYE